MAMTVELYRRGDALLGLTLLWLGWVRCTDRSPFWVLSTGLKIRSHAVTLMATVTGGIHGSWSTFWRIIYEAGLHVIVTGILHIFIMGKK